MSVNIDTDFHAPGPRAPVLRRVESAAPESLARAATPFEAVESFAVLHGAPADWTPFNTAVFVLMSSALALALVRAVEAVAGLLGA